MDRLVSWRVWPISAAVFLVFMASSLALTLHRLFPRRSAVLGPAALALAASGFDYLENLLAWAALLAFPEPVATNSLLGAASAAKTTFSWLAGILLLVLVAAIAVQETRRRIVRRGLSTTALLDDVIRPAGLDADEFAVYSVLASGDGMTPTELALWMAAPPTTVSSYVKRSERRGHVRRVPHPDDRRSYRLQLTAAGRRAHGTAGDLFLPVLDQVADEVGRGLSDTHRRLRALHRAVTTVERGPR